MAAKTATPVRKTRKVQTVPIDGEAFVNGIGNLTKAFEQNSAIIHDLLSPKADSSQAVTHNQAKEAPIAIDGATDLSSLIRSAHERAGFLIVYSDELRQRIVHGGVHENSAGGEQPISMSYGPNKDCVLGIHNAFGIIARNLDEINTYLLAQ